MAGNESVAYENNTQITQGLIAKDYEAAQHGSVLGKLGHTRLHSRQVIQVIG